MYLYESTSFVGIGLLLHVAELNKPVSCFIGLTTLPRIDTPFILPFTLSFFKNVVFPAQAEYSYFCADFRLKIFLHYS